MPADQVHCPACHDQFSVAPATQSATCPRCNQTYSVLRQTAPVVLLQEPRRPPASNEGMPGANFLMWVIGIGLILFVLYALVTGA